MITSTTGTGTLKIFHKKVLDETITLKKEGVYRWSSPSMFKNKDLVVIETQDAKVADVFITAFVQVNDTRYMNNICYRGLKDKEKKRGQLTDCHNKQLLKGGFGFFSSIMVIFQ